jgi:nucleoside-diphosphate-sugar epimerase
MRILITGVRGFLGKSLLPLVSDNELLLLNRSPLHLSSLNHIELIGDLSKPELWSKQVLDFDPECCIHLAWDGLPDYSLRKCTINITNSLRLLEVLQETSVKRIVVSGSCWEYGNVSGSTNENTLPANPGLFAASKEAIRIMFSNLAAKKDIDLYWARLFFLYGPGQRSTSLIPYLYSSLLANNVPALKEPGSIQDFLYIDDAADAIYKLCTKNCLPGIYNIGSGVGTSVSDIANLVALKFKGEAFTPTTSVSLGFWADSTKIFEQTGWTANTSLENGLVKTIEAFGQVS